MYVVKFVHVARLVITNANETKTTHIGLERVYRHGVIRLVVVEGLMSDINAEPSSKMSPPHGFITY